MALMMCVQVSAQKIDFNLPGKETQGLEDGFENWSIGRTKGEASGQFLTEDGQTVSIIASPVSGLNNGMMCDWWKDGVTKGCKLLGDVLYSVNIDDANNYTFDTGKPMGLEFRITGLPAGKHTLTAYHNNTSGSITKLAPIAVKLNGTTVQSGVEQTNRLTSDTECGMSYITFTVGAGETVTVQYVTEPKSGVTYTNTSVAVNALVFDRPMPTLTASEPIPSHLDMHYDCDGGKAQLSWKAGTTAAKHHIYIGKSESLLSKVAVTTAASYSLNNPSVHDTYYWRIDEEDASGTVHQGDVWSFRPRRLAFPGAEGYGRFAIGGRGGTVYHVTSLDDDVDNPQPGTFRYGIRNVSGPRTIVFDVSGYITLKGRLTCSDKYVTIAGQTAPGKGICFRGAPFGVGSDGITRFIRNRRGYAGDKNGPIVAEQDKGLDGIGSAGGDHTIIDHCSISWTTDEAFSSRGAKNLTLQHTLISEALNRADHPNYGSGSTHGYAATIGGGENSATLAVGSYHHNLLAHCEGRNWSLSGGLDGAGYYDGHHDVFNNVVYNWGSRATDGGTHELNFVNNFYKKGPSTSQNYLLRMQFEGTGKGTQAAYVSGNIRQETSGTMTQDKQGTTYTYSTSGGQVLDWEPFVSAPFFPSCAVIESAEQAYHNVLSDVGCTMPVLDDHDVRIVRETYGGTYTYTGSKTGKKGLIDREWDAGGYEEMPEESRPADYDTDQDGMPDWWETATGTNPLVADNNDDADGDGYTALEDYLNWIAQPHFVVAESSTSIELAPYFAGYGSSATYTVSGTGASVASGKLTVSGTKGLSTVSVTCKESGFSLTRNFNFCFTDVASGISEIRTPQITNDIMYNLAGQRVANNAKGIVIVNGKKVLK